MKKITHHYGVELDWVESYAEQLEGKVEGNFIQVPDHIHTGVRYFLNCDFGVSALYMDVLYNTEIHFKQENVNDDFIGVYYNLTEGEAVYMSDSEYNTLGRWDFNLSFVDSSLGHNYIVTTGSKVLALCIFIKKDVIKEYIRKNPFLQEHVDNIFDPNKNTIVKFTRMSNTSYHLLMDFHSKEVGGESFDFHMRGTVQRLLAEFIERLTFEDIVIDTVNNHDLKGIIKSQNYLIDNLSQVFPTISFLATNANMSGSKYKRLFKKITGLTPNIFFLHNKLLESKRLLLESRLTIAQVSDQLNFSNHSYFAARFKEFFGMSPNDFLKQLL